MRLDAERTRQALDWSKREGIECLYLLAEFEAVTLTAAQSHGFVAVDARVILECRKSEGAAEPVDPMIRPAREADVPALREIAGQSHHDSRFYSDPHFQRAKCDELYQVWIENSVKGSAQATFVADRGGRPRGYITVHVDGPGEGRIGLLGVASEAQGAGLGSALVRRALAWCASHAVTNVTVVTQGVNVRAQRLYQRHGFVTQWMGLWFHRWGEAPKSDCHG